MSYPSQLPDRDRKLVELTKLLTEECSKDIKKDIIERILELGYSGHELKQELQILRNAKR